MVRGCRLLIEAHGHYLHVLYAVNDMTNTFELLFCLSFLHLRPPLRGHRLLEVTVHALRCLDAVCVAPSVIPSKAIPRGDFHVLRRPLSPAGACGGTRAATPPAQPTVIYFVSHQHFSQTDIFHLVRECSGITSRSSFCSSFSHYLPNITVIYYYCKKLGWTAPWNF